MTYLERNQAIIDELRGVRLERGDIVGSSSSMSFTSAGHYRSSVLGNTLYVGLKEYTDPEKCKSSTEARALLELHCICTVAEQLPHLEVELPVFYGILFDRAGKPLGIVTEDFSKGGKYEVQDMTYDRPELLPNELGEIFPDMDYYELARVCFSVNGQRRLGDFSTSWSNEFSHKFLMDDVVDQLEEGKHTLRLGYEL